MKIIHQQQPTHDTCVSACIAMLLNIPVKEIVEEFHSKYINQELNIYEFLINHDLNIEPLLPSYWQAELNNIYIASVPSLNKKAALHQIIIDTRNGASIVYDPQEGKPDCDYYVYKPDEDLKTHEYNLISYVLEYRVL